MPGDPSRGRNHARVLTRADFRSGKVLAAGKKNLVLTARALSKAFAAPIRLNKKSNRYALSVIGERRRVI